ncbi:MAG: hypothetical protein BroJett040_04080 [Oligoflexia bacterium]|nr:MAG: hypothetical protein BroJett040_04080 [Oligoflexia bacterium]
MSKLRIFREGVFLKEFELVPGQGYTAGRGDSCHIRLDPEAGISRQHFELVPTGNTWQVNVLSKYGELYINNEKQSGFSLVSGGKFRVPPYEFHFMISNESTSPAPQAQSQTESGDFEKTMVQVMPSAAYMKIIDSRGHLVQNLRLEGDSWIAGRETTCNIFIDSQKISRQQFEMYSDGGNYFVKDCGSANGTLLNGVPLSQQEWSPIQSGDVLTVVDWTLKFEIRDASYDQRMRDVAPELKAPVYIDPTEGGLPPQGDFDPSQMNPDLGPPAYLGQAQPPAPYHQNYQTGYAPVNYEPPQPQGQYQSQAPPSQQPAGAPPASKWAGKIQELKAKMNPVRVAILALVVLGLGFALFSDDGGTKQAAKVKEKTPFDKLSPEDQQFVQHTFNLGKQLIMQGRYQNARDEMIKLHAKLPSGYEDSKEVLRSAEHALALVEEQRLMEQKEKERIEIEEKIQRQVATCKAQITDKTEVVDVENCLAPVLAYNPEHPMIVELKSQVEKAVTDRQVKAAQKEEYMALVRKLKQIFDKAEATYKEGRPREAIKSFELVIASKLPDPNDLKGKSKRTIASIQQKMANDQAVYEKKSEELHKAGKLREAIVMLKKAVEINPENEVTKGRLTVYLGELRKQMQGFYQEGILEESIGDVEAAKVKWKKIIDQSLPDEDYYQKATIKLKKYGVY